MYAKSNGNICFSYSLPLRLHDYTTTRRHDYMTAQVHDYITIRRHDCTIARS